ncbi:MAG: aminopeptidase P family protein [Clostridia bacterium]|nr:aminopeptidase P family protein [Clostridia bacterium]
MFNTDKLWEKISVFSDAALIFSMENRRYFTQFPSSDGALLVYGGKALFFTDSRYTEAAAKCIGEDKVIDSSNLYEKLKEIFSVNGVKRIAVENDKLTLAEFDNLKEKLPEFEFVTSSALSTAIEEIRIVKEASEVTKIKAAQKIAEDAFSHILTFIKEGMTEKEISLELDFYMLSHGAEAVSFETIAVAGKNSSMPHGVPGEYKIQKGDFITMDFGATVDGYHSDMTRTVCVGEPSEKQKEVYETVLKAQNAALDVLHDGITGVEADKIARDIIENAGYGKNFGHGLGHGVGVEIHEAPNLSPRASHTLKEGHVVTVEPGIYLPGEFGVRIEDMAIITKDGCINLTNCPKELIIL